MQFNSYVFIGFFLPVTVAGFAVAVRLGRQVAVGWLIAASLLFYAWWNPGSLPILLGSVLGNYALSRLIRRTGGRRQTVVTAFGVAANLGALAWCKYLAAVLDILGLHAAATHAGDPVLPLGLSFFTFTQIGYLLDCRAGLAERSSLPDYVLFVTFFPSIAAGPILTDREIMPQLADRMTWRPSAMNLCIGGGFFLIGLLKKTLLADPLSEIVAPGFARPDALSLLVAWQTALGYSLQLYFDFSGYSDMAIGLGRMFGLRLP
ncbi:MAG TPA: MBOAT family O-acyltransferase, partial [Acetobacteraceae bacterium]